MKKFLGGLVLIVVVLIVLAVLAVFLFIDPLAKAGVEKGTTQALGVGAKVQAVNISILGGQAVIKDLDISNPQEFASPLFVHTGKFDVVVDTGSVFSDTVKVTKFELDGLEMHIEEKLPQSNIDKIMEHIKSLSKDQKESKPAKNVHIDRVVIRDIKAYFHPVLTVPGAKPIAVEIKELVLDDVNSQNKGSVVGQVVAQLIPEILAGVFKQAQGLVPADFLNNVDKSVVGDVGKGAAKTVEGAGKTVTEGLGKILGGKDK